VLEAVKKRKPKFRPATCPICGNGFERSGPAQKYCTPACKAIAMRPRKAAYQRAYKRSAAGRAAEARYRAAHPDRLRAKEIRRRERRREWKRAYDRAYYAAHADPNRRAYTQSVPSAPRVSNEELDRRAMLL